MEFTEKAKEFARKAHRGQVRRSGEPYDVHPEAVASILREFGADDTVLTAAYLHDVLEDTEIKSENIRAFFGDEIADLVLGVTNLKRIEFAGEDEYQRANIEKMFLAMARDIRVVIIKLADRLHNMRTIGFLSDERQNKMAYETLHLFAPLADRVGIGQIRWELEDLAFQVLNPVEYRDIAAEIDERRSEREAKIAKAVAELERKLRKAGVEAVVVGRPKHIYSIWQKVKRRGKDLEDVFDLLGLRVILADITACYLALNTIHNEYLQVTGRYKDYIAHPKPNNYQSIHTTVENDAGWLVEIQIRTKEMDRIAEYGIAAHWIYRQRRYTQSGAGKTTSQLLGQVAKELDGGPSADAINSYLADIPRNDVFVFTPRGEIKRLPRGGTPVDFAFTVHTQVGFRCVGAKVNGRLSNLRRKLETGDTVEIITSQSAKPSRDWLDFVASNSARNKIRSYFRKIDRNELKRLGKQIIEREARKRNLTVNLVLNAPGIADFLEARDLSSADDLLAKVGEGVLSPNAVLTELLPPEKPEPREIPTGIPDYSGYVIVGEMDDLPIRMGRCCNPMPMVKLKGYITRIGVITIHRDGCSNLRNADPARLVRARWAVDETISRDIALRMKVRGNEQTLSEILREIEGGGRTVMGLSNEGYDGQFLTTVVHLRLASKERLKELKRRLSRNDSVASYSVIS
ncbi:MAG: bifunctional (p)ppGpp synthetase/guanosine-3',5'-bis(diphosphate) 3'-pyrophosphohydrolase [bacterium]|nr:bifunctional (p)ppGpp synthetase/guanosine-3',5'-bis(diphosphate) 3'-pyrophosphohydrolase [bacterium]